MRVFDLAVILTLVIFAAYELSQGQWIALAAAIGMLSAYLIFTEV